MNIVVLISGSGSNLQALIDQQDNYGYRISCVLSNQADAYGLVRAENASIATCVVDHRQYEQREAFEQAMIAEIDQHQPDLVVLAGFMRILTPVFVSHYQGKLLNIHPSLLPKFKGINTHEQALAAGETEHGASVHWVIPELDSGQIIAQASVAVMADDDANALAARVLTVEHQLYPAVVAAIVQGKVRAEATDSPLLSLPELLALVQS